MTELRSLSLGNNPITDVAPLTNIGELEELLLINPHFRGSCCWPIRCGGIVTGEVEPPHRQRGQRTSRVEFSGGHHARLHQLHPQCVQADGWGRWQGKLEFWVKVVREAGVPYVTKGPADVNLKIM